MSLLYPASETLATTRGTTRQELIKAILAESGLGDYGTATAGTTVSLDDTTKLKSSQYSTDEWVDGWIRISKNYDSVGSAPEGSISPITTYDPDTNGRVSFNPAYSSAVGVSDDYELWRYPHPKLVLDLIDGCLTNDLPIPYWSLLSEIPDFDMEQNNTSDWASSNATISKQTTNSWSGLRYLRVLSTAANGYARSQLMNVEPGKQYYVSAEVRCSTSATTAKLIAYDETNSAAITTQSVIRLQPVRVNFTFTAPSTCYQISIRLSNTVNTTTTEWCNVVLYSTESREISLPWWVKSDAQVKGIFSLTTNSMSNNIDDVTLQGEIDSRWSVKDNSFGRGKLKLVARHGTISDPLYIFGIRYETAYSDDTTDSKLFDDIDYPLSCVLYRLFLTISNEPREGLLDSKWIAGKLQMYDKRWKEQVGIRDQRIERVLRSQSSWGLFSHETDRLGVS